MLKMPTYVMDVDVNENSDSTSYGATIWQIVGNPYMVINLADHTKKREDKEYDELQLTVVHELFHAVQRLYVFKGRANYGFDEMSAQALEADAFEYMRANDQITTDKHLKNMKVLRYFAIPLDSYSSTYPEGTVGGVFKEGKAATASVLVANTFALVLLCIFPFSSG